MRKSLKSKFVYIAFAALILSVAACGNKKTDSNMPTDSKTAQPQDSVMVVEEETVVVAIDSIAPETPAANKTMTTPKKTK